MMKKFIIIIQLFIAISPIYSKENDNKDVNRVEMRNLNEKFDALNKSFENQLSSNDRTLNKISSQIEATSFNLTIFGIILGFIAVGLGVYVTFIERKIVQLRDENKALLDETKRAKNEVEELNNKIQNDIYGLFLKIKKEETNHLLDRMIKVPKDISNLFNELASRELDDNDFQKIKQAYTKLKGLKSHESFIYNYHVLFFQHFLYQIMGDNSLHSEVLKNYQMCVDCAFDNDIIKSTNDFIRFIIRDRNIEKYNNEIKIFSSAIANSEFKEFNELFDLISKLLANSENRIKYMKALSSESRDDKEFKIRFGTIVLSELNGQDLSDEETSLKIELEALEKQIAKEYEEIRIKQEEEQHIRDEREKQRIVNTPH